MNLNDLWFFLIMVLFCGYFFLEGFDFGVGMLTGLIGKEDVEKRIMINSIGPVWDANEVWLLTAGGAIFAAFPGWYATMFSGFYMALFLLLAALIVRGVAFEFRGKVENASWKKAWDVSMFVGSIIPPLLLGVALANLIKGVPIDASTEFVGNFFDLLSVPTVIAGLTSVVVFIYHGAVYLTLKVEGALMEKAFKAAKLYGIVALGLTVLSLIVGGMTTDAFSNVLSLIAAIVAIVALGISYGMILKKRSGISMIANGVAVISAVASVFLGMFPRVMVSSLGDEFSLTIQSVSSSPYTLKVMTIVTLTVLPIVLAYLGWTYWIFRKRVKTTDHLEY